MANERKKRVEEILPKIIKIIESAGYRTKLHNPSYHRTTSGFATSHDLPIPRESTKMAVSLGGDGTFIYTARMCHKFQIPVLGVNLGRIGFLTEVEPDEINRIIPMALKGELQTEKRMVLEATVNRFGNQMTLKSINEMVVAKGGFSRIVSVIAEVDEKYLSTYTGDGIIVSTPTGSTAYSLAAGGPVVYPTLNSIIINPLCPHALGVRPLVVGGSSTVKIKIETSSSGVVLTADGQESIDLVPMDEVIIKKSPTPIFVFKHPEKDFFSILREKLKWID